MTKKSNTKDVGWMYYTPTKREDHQAVQYPPPSQIPGLGGPGQEPPHDERKMWIKESDSPYIRLAKQGGRADLLAFRENTPKSEAKDYPRCDWFYQQDQALEEQGDDTPYVFKLPEYMVHKQPSLSGMSGEADGHMHYTPSRLPYAVDTVTVYERDDKCTDKTVHIPNARRVGYGIRQEKQPLTFADKKAASGQQNPNARRRTKSGVEGNPDEPVNMHKLMAGTYEREWHERRQDFESKHGAPAPGGGAKLSTEYKESYHKMLAEKTRNAAHGKHRRGDENEDHREDRKVDREIEKMEKEVFKLSRFKNVNSKVDTNRHQEQGPYEPSKSDAPKRSAICT